MLSESVLSLYKTLQITSECFSFNKPFQREIKGVTLLQQLQLEKKKAAAYLLVHDDGQLSGQVSVVCLHLVVVFLLVLFDQSLVNAQTVATGLHKMPAYKNTVSMCWGGIICSQVQDLHISPEDLFQLLDLVIWILLGTRVVQKSSGVCKWSRIYLW